MHGNDNTQCPEFHGGQNVSKLYIDSSQPSEQGTGKWTTDETLSFKCVTDEFKPVKCNCKKYKVWDKCTLPLVIRACWIQWFLIKFEKLEGQSLVNYWEFSTTESIKAFQVAIVQAKRV